jgi:hypothetical protein
MQRENRWCPALTAFVFAVSVESQMFFEKQPQIPFDFAQGRLSTHHPQAEKRLGPRSLRMTTRVLLRNVETGHKGRLAQDSGGWR